MFINDFLSNVIFNVILKAHQKCITSASKSASKCIKNASTVHQKCIKNTLVYYITSVHVSLGCVHVLVSACMYL